MVERDTPPGPPVAGREDDLALTLIEQRPSAEQQKPYGIYWLEPPDPATVLAEHIELQEFERTFNNSPEVMAKEYGPYQAASKFILAIDHEEAKPVGVMRVIVNSPAGLKSLNDLEKPPWGVSLDHVLGDNGLNLTDLDQTWDIATIAVSPDYQGLRAGIKVSDALLRSALGLARNRNIATFVAIIDDEVLRLRFDRLTDPPPFNRFIGLSPQPYLDSPSSTPVYASLAQMEQRTLQTSAKRHARLFAGVGLEDISFPEELVST